MEFLKRPDLEGGSSGYRETRKEANAAILGRDDGGLEIESVDQILKEHL